ncbi:MAG: hypothetical protein NVSMB63_08850 [Sediminibacterium sp.]
MPMSSRDFNLVHVAAVLQQKWKALVLIVLVTMVVATVTVFVVPPYYRSAATIVPANTLLADKARLFNNNIHQLYSYFGSGDDLDRIYGIANTDNSFKTLVDTFGLVSYYGLSGENLPLLRQKAVTALRKDLDLQKTDLNQLKIIAWTKDKNLSADLVNKMVAIIQQTASTLWQSNYNQSINKLEETIHSMETAYRQLNDSTSKAAAAQQVLWNVKTQTLLEQLKQYRKTADEFKLAGETNPPALYVLEKGAPASKAERPDKIAIILTAGLTGLAFGCLLLLAYQRKQTA